jgi:transposase InsO family protein
VARLRKSAGIEARRKRRFRLTVENHATAPPAPNLVQQQFTVAQPNLIWVGDMTFIRTRAGFLYLAVLLDLFGRRVVGWAMWAVPGFKDTLLRCSLKREVSYGYEKAIQPGIQT